MMRQSRVPSEKTTPDDCLSLAPDRTIERRAVQGTTVHWRCSRWSRFHGRYCLETTSLTNVQNFAQIFNGSWLCRQECLFFRLFPGDNPITPVFVQSTIKSRGRLFIWR
jgi:hypothetical protein